jgi:hypothetical protein
MLSLESTEEIKYENEIANVDGCQKTPSSYYSIYWKRSMANVAVNIGTASIQ